MKRISVAAIAACIVLCSSANAQTCRVNTVTGSGSTSNVVAGFEKQPTAPGNSDQIDTSYYVVSNQAGLGPDPVVRTMFSSWMQTGADDADHVAIYGATLVNPTNVPITVTVVDFTSNVDQFTPTATLDIVPANGWQPVAMNNRPSSDGSAASPLRRTVRRTSCSATRLPTARPTARATRHSA